MKSWLLVAVAAIALLLTAIAGGAVNVQSASAKVAVSQGIGSALLQGGNRNGGPPVFPIGGNTAGNTPEQVSFILDAQHLDQLEARVLSGFNHYLSTAQFASQYGQSRQNIGELQAYLAHYGIHTSAMADGLDIQASGTADQFNKALSVSQRNYQTAPIPARHGHPAIPGRQFHGSPTNPLLPRQLASFVLAILGLSNYPAFSSDAIRTPALAANVAPAKEQDGDLTPENFASQYNLPHGSGAGSTIAIVTLAALDQPSAQYFWSNVLGISTKANRINVVNVDGGPGAVSDAAGSGESTLDVEQSGALAPQANIDVYQAPNTDPGFLDAFFQAASDNQADTVSASWGEAETVINYFVKNGAESPAYQQTFDEAFLEMAAQGQSAFVSSGDAGAYDDSDELGSTNLDVDSPGNSPYVTSSGGTTLPGTIPLGATDTATIAAERAWGWDWLWPHFADFCGSRNSDGSCAAAFPDEGTFAKAAAAGDGGGYSALESMPQYQRQVGASHYNAVPYLTPTALDSTDFAPLTLPTDWNFNASPTVQSGTGQGRVEPDVSADADPFTGYELYFSFGDQPATLETGWGGTSFVAPQLNGSTALIDANLGHRVGFWNPQVYSFATQHNSPFHTLDSASADNDNLFYTGSPGQVYNPATGLGTPDLSALQGDFAHGGH